MPPLQASNSAVPKADHQQPTADAANLIMPKKLANPCVDSADHQSLRRELLFNQKMYDILWFHIA